MNINVLSLSSSQRTLIFLISSPTFIPFFPIGFGSLIGTSSSPRNTFLAVMGRSCIRCMVHECSFFSILIIVSTDF
ncbi:hypothetical protein QVD17_37902 [Tagetes erecta]|uniref:Uncharacterized protein n=1 Tax=Tagetes erecta TaxID=13708 RepID=A0AAD8JV29_TARER|nr:hypothetical protein QVD17_37902 [Tagetes erecta]